MSIVDAQVHLHNRTYFEAHLGRDRLPYAQAGSNGGYVFHLSDGNAVPIPSVYFEIDEQVERLSASGIDVMISSMGAFTVDHLPVEQARDLAMQLNEERAELEKRFFGTYRGLALLPLNDVAAAVETLDDAVRRLGLRGVCVGSNVRGGSIASSELRPLYRRVEELGVPVFIHPTASVLEDRIRRYGHEYTLGFMIDSSIAALDLIFSGVLEDHPGLKVVHPHLGGILPYLGPRIDHEHAKPWSGTEPLARRPSEYLRRFYTDTVSLNGWALEACLHIYGPDRLLFASDFPYWEPEQSIALVRERAPAEHVDAILADNAAALLDL